MTRVDELKYHTGEPHPRSLLLCRTCGSEYSSDRGDYFAASPDTVLKCCNMPLAHVRKMTRYEDCAS